MNGSRHEGTGSKTQSVETSTSRAGYQAAWIALVVAAGATYLLTLRPDVSNGDSAEMQVMCALLGICHSPGYGLETVVGKLFTWLPIGSGAAWRVNLLQAVSGVVGLVALFAALRRVIGQDLPAAAAAMTLGFSAVYWMHCVEAEVYVFHAMFLMIGIYALIRFREGEGVGWFYAAASALGVCIGNRLCEIAILPGLWILLSTGVMRRRLNWKRWAAAIGLGLAPFVFNVAYYMARENPNYLHARDDAYRDKLLGYEDAFVAESFAGRLKWALEYCAGLTGAGREGFTEFSWERLGWDLDKYAWHLSGAAALGDRFPEEQRVEGSIEAFRQREQGPGTSIGLLGALLTLAGLRRWRTHGRLILAGAAMFAGNLAYYLYMHPVDNLHFTIPGLTGLAFLIGLGASSKDGRRSWLQYGAFAAPAFLLLTNYGALDYRTAEFEELREGAAKVKATVLPENTAIVAMYPRAQRLRYLYWVEAGVTDVQVVAYRETYDKDDLRRLVMSMRKEGRYILFSGEAVGVESTREKLGRWTPAEYLALDLYSPFPYRAPSVEN